MAMRSFHDIEKIAAERHGGKAAMEARLSVPLDAEALAKVPLATWLEEMARAIFQAGFSWKVVEAKWPAFRAAFAEFDPAVVATWHDEDVDRLLKDDGIVRNGAKIAAVIENARFLVAWDDETGSAARTIAEWPISDQAGLVTTLSKRGSHLGGFTAQRVCRVVGRDSYILSKDVLARLKEEGVVGGPATSKAAMARVQAAFNRWHRETGRPLTQLSQIIAMSVGERREDVASD